MTDAAAPAIVGLRTHVLSVPLHTPFVTAIRRTSTIDTTVVEITDADGAVGWGEAPAAWRITGDSQASAVACLEGPLAAVLVGAPGDPREVAPLVQAAVVGNTAAKMAADIAVHDLAARRAGLPLADHLAAYATNRTVTGGSSERTVQTDVTLAAGRPDQLAEAARARVADGFAVLKVKVGTDADADVERVRAVREAVGADVGLRLDANQGWDAHTAVRVIAAMEDAGLGVELVEQPVPASDLTGLAHVTRHVDTPVMADESLFDLDDLVEIIRTNAVDRVNVKLAKSGGLTPALELIDVARRHGLGLMVGSMMESHLGVGAAAALVAAQLSGTTIDADLDAAWWAVRSPYTGGIRYDGSTVVLPDGPGLGIDGVTQ